MTTAGETTGGLSYYSYSLMDGVIMVMVSAAEAKDVMPHAPLRKTFAQRLINKHCYLN